MSRKPTIIRARFQGEVKIGGNELNYWAADRHESHTCEARAEGLVFTPNDKPRTGPPTDAEVLTKDEDVIETVVPWPNVRGYDRRR